MREGGTGTVVGMVVPTFYASYPVPYYVRSTYS